MADSPAAFRDFRGTQGQIDDADPEGSKEQAPLPSTSVPSPGGTTFAQAARTKHAGTSSEPAFGAPTARPEISSENREEAIRQAQADRLAALNINAGRQRASQSTDGSQ